MISATTPSSRRLSASRIANPVLPVAVVPAITSKGGAAPLTTGPSPAHRGGRRSSATPSARGSSRSGPRENDAPEDVRAGVLDPGPKDPADELPAAGQVDELVLAAPPDDPRPGVGGAIAIVGVRSGCGDAVDEDLDLAAE